MTAAHVSLCHHHVVSWGKHLLPFGKQVGTVMASSVVSLLAGKVADVTVATKIAVMVSEKKFMVGDGVVGDRGKGMGGKVET